MKKLLEEGVGTRFIASAPMTCRRGAQGWCNEARHGRPLDASPPALRSPCLLANNLFIHPSSRRTAEFYRAICYTYQEGDDTYSWLWLLVVLNKQNNSSGLLTARDVLDKSALYGGSQERFCCCEPPSAARSQVPE